MDTVVDNDGDSRERAVRQPGECDWPTRIALWHALLDRDPIAARPLC
jgi:hypothetical protein